jgi:hypothetical protein
VGRNWDGGTPYGPANPAPVNCPWDKGTLGLFVVGLYLVPLPAARGGVRFYRRWLTRFTASCPNDVSCSAGALAALVGPGARRRAVRFVRSCGARRPAAVTEKPCGDTE